VIGHCQDEICMALNRRPLTWECRRRVESHHNFKTAAAARSTTLGNGANKTTPTHTAHVMGAISTSRRSGATKNVARLLPFALVSRTAAAFGP
jgi:hypothetical protein